MDSHAVRLQIRTVPGSARAGLVGPYGDAWKVRVTAAPEKGRANEELVRVLAEIFGVDRDAVTVVAGASSRDKVVEIQGMSTEQIFAALGSSKP